MHKRFLAAVVGVLAAGALVLGGTVAGAASHGKQTKGVLYVALTHTVGSTQYLAGNSSDKVLGPGAATYTAKVGEGSKPGTLKVVANVIIFTRNGSFQGKATSTLTVNSDGSVTYSNGKINAAKGQGGQKGHTFVATFTGAGKSIAGPFVFNYKGTYK